MLQYGKKLQQHLWRNNAMKLSTWLLFSIMIVGCRQHTPATGHTAGQSATTTNTAATYAEALDNIDVWRKQMQLAYPASKPLPAVAKMAMTNFWVQQISDELYIQWVGTSWDFNGIAEGPRKGPIACGIFVTTLLRDMQVPVKRLQLGSRASSVIMRTIAPGQSIQNLSRYDAAAFNDYLAKQGKAVYIIGLDYHTGFIVADGKSAWFIHSNYIGRKGVVKENVQASAALRASKTKWLCCLTCNDSFMEHWLRH